MVEQRFILLLQRQGLAQKTTLQLIHNLDKILAACSPLSEDSLIAFIAAQSQMVSAAALNKYLQAAHKWFDFKHIPYKKGTFQRIPERPKIRPTFSDDEIDRFLALPPIPGRYDRGGYRKMKMFWTIVAWTGARPGEVRKLDVNCVDFATGAFIFPITKTGTGRAVIIHPLIKPVVKDYVSTLKTKLLFPSYQFPDRPFTDAAYLKDFNQRIARLGIIKDVDPYCFRHSLATGTLNNDAGLLDVQDILGHKDPKTTRIYKRGNIRAQERALNKYAFVEKKLGGKGLISRIDEYIANMHLEEKSEIDFAKILEARKLLWESIRLSSQATPHHHS